MAFRRLAAPTSGLARAVSASEPLFRPRFGIRHASTPPASVVDAGFWKSLVPKPLRKENPKDAGPRSKEWNPATYFIVMFLFIGSMSIQMIALRKQAERYERQSAIRIGLLRQVVERIRSGEEVDVEKVLGTGDAQREADWDEGESACARADDGARCAERSPVLRAIERDEVVRRPEKEETPKRPETPEKPTSTPKSSEHAGAPEPQPAKARTASLSSFF